MSFNKSNENAELMFQLKYSLEICEQIGKKRTKIETKNVHSIFYLEMFRIFTMFTIFPISFVPPHNGIHMLRHTVHIQMTGKKKVKAETSNQLS